MAYAQSNFREIIFGPGNFGVLKEALAIFIDPEHLSALGSRGCPMENLFADNQNCASDAIM